MKKKNLLMTVIAICGIATISMAQTVPSYVPTTGLVGWWPFNGNANDESGNGNNCTIYNSPTLCPDRNLVSNSAYFLNGTNNWINTNSAFLQTSNPHSISIWWQTTDSTKTNQTLFNTNPHTLENFAFHYSSSSNTPPYGLAFGMGNGLSGNGSWNVMHPDNGQITTPPTRGIWHHAVWVKDASLIWKFYFDGNLIHTFNSNINTGSQLADLRFGAENAGYPTGGANFKGNLDDIGVWNRALDSCEIKDLYFGSLGNCCNISVSTQPINQSVNISNNAQFTTASSDPLATYQWQTDLGVGYLNLNSVGQYSGTANDTLTIANTTLSNNSQPFRCIISSGSCTDTSNVAVLTVLCNISVTTQPINQSVNISNNAQFTTASSDPLSTYQWQSDNGFGFQNISNAGQYSGTTNDTLTIANTTLSNNNQAFRCIISSGSCSDTSAVAVLTVTNNVGINEVSQSNLFSVYPNPANSQINVKADAKLLGSIYTVYDNTGKLVLSGKIISENTTIELGNLSGGIYLFSVGENLKQTFIVTKE
jgi:hypothetical protein